VALTTSERLIKQRIRGVEGARPSERRSAAGRCSRGPCHWVSRQLEGVPGLPRARNSWEFV